MKYTEFVEVTLDKKLTKGESAGFIPWLLLVSGALLMFIPTLVTMTVIIATFTFPPVETLIIILRLFLSGLFLLSIPIVSILLWMYICWKAEGGTEEDK